MAEKVVKYWRKKEFSVYLYISFSMLNRPLGLLQSCGPPMSPTRLELFHPSKWQKKEIGNWSGVIWAPGYNWFLGPPCIRFFVCGLSGTRKMLGGDQDPMVKYLFFWSLILSRPSNGHFKNITLEGWNPASLGSTYNFKMPVYTHLLSQWLTCRLNLWGLHS